MGIVRSTSDHIGWIFLDPVAAVESKESFAEILETHFHEISEYASSYLTAEDVAVVIPSLGDIDKLFNAYSKLYFMLNYFLDALYRLNFLKLRHEFDQTVGYSVLSLSAPFILEVDEDVQVPNLFIPTIIDKTRSAIIYGASFHHLLFWIGQQGTFYLSINVTTYHLYVFLFLLCTQLICFTIAIRN